MIVRYYVMGPCVYIKMARLGLTFWPFFGLVCAIWLTLAPPGLVVIPVWLLRQVDNDDYVRRVLKTDDVKPPSGKPERQRESSSRSKVRDVCDTGYALYIVCYLLLLYYIYCGISVQSDERVKLFTFIIISCHIIDFKWQNCLKVGTDKPKLKSRDVVSIRWWCLEKISWKATLWADGESWIQTRKLLYPPAGRPGKHSYRRNMHIIVYPV